MYVWVLVLLMTVNSYGAHTVVIENIATPEDCVELGNRMLQRVPNAQKANCFAVKKAK